MTLSMCVMTLSMCVMYMYVDSQACVTQSVNVATIEVLKIDKVIRQWWSHSHNYRAKPVQGEVRFIEEVVEMSESWEEEIGRDEHADQCVDRQHLKQNKNSRKDEWSSVHMRLTSIEWCLNGWNLAGAGDVIDEDDELHPALPLVRLIAVQHRRLWMKWQKHLASLF